MAINPAKTPETDLEIIRYSEQYAEYSYDPNKLGLPS